MTSSKQHNEVNQPPPLVPGQQENPDLFRPLVESAAEIIFCTDADGRMTFLNQAWTRITGFTIEEGLGNPLSNWVVDPDAKVFSKLFKPTAKSDANWRQDIQVRTKTAAPRWLALNARAMRNAEGSIRGITGSLLDIHDRIQMEQDLKQSEQRYAMVACASNDGIWDWDLLNDKIYLSPRWKSMLGYADDELDGSFAAWHDRVHPDDIKQAMNDVMACLEGRTEYYENVHRLRHKNGSWRWILDRGVVFRDESGKALRMTGAHADVTLLKSIEETLLQRERELEAIFSISPDGIVTVTHDGLISSVNPAFLQMTGLNKETIVGMPESQFNQLVLSICDPQFPYQPDLLGGDGQPQAMLQLVNTGSKPRHPLRRRSDNQFSFRLRKPRLRVLKRTVRRLSDQAIAKVMYFRDVSIETEVDRMKSEFLSTAAHELRTPMASVYGFSQLLLSREFDADTTKDILKTIHQQTKSLVSMLNELLDLARIEARAGKDFQFAVQPLQPVVRRALAELLVPGDDRNVKAEIPDVLTPVYIDAEKIKQVVTNVLSNAYKYSPGGGEIQLRMLVRIRDDGSREIGVSIQDHGIGMTPDQQSHLYERFWRADTSGMIQGTGLGMSIVKEIMDIHQGEIEVQSTYGLGTTIILWFKEMQSGEAHANHS